MQIEKPTIADSSLISGVEFTTNKVTSISAGSTDAQYGSAKLLFDQLALKEATANKKTSISAQQTNTNFLGELASMPLLGNGLVGLDNVVGAVKNSTVDAEHDITFAAGIRCLDSTRTILMTSTAMTKRTDVAYWTDGDNGGLHDSGRSGGGSISRSRTSNIATIAFDGQGDFGGGTYIVNMYGFSGTGYNLCNVVGIFTGDSFSYACPGADEGVTADTGGNVTEDVRLGCTLHCYLISKADGATDYCTSIRADAPTYGQNIDSDFSYSRRIWSIVLDSSSHIIPFKQEGKFCRYNTPQTNGSGELTLNTETNFTVPFIPLGIPLKCEFNLYLFTTYQGDAHYLCSIYIGKTTQVLDVYDTKGSAISPLSALLAGDGYSFWASVFNMITTTSGQIRTKGINMDKIEEITLAVIGYEDITL